MKERPVIFNSEMVRAILDGRKTQTRRIAKADNSNHLLGCPFGQVGDRLWVRETFAAFDADWKHPGKPHDLRAGPWPNVVYPASVAKIPDGTCRPSIHMPRWASRITLEITAVRVERLNDISEEDAEAEGIDMEALYDSQDCYDCIADHNMTGRPTVTGAFKYLWESIYGVDSWSVNPWVWVIEFRRVEVRDASK